MVEFVNRLITGLVSVAVIVAVLGVARRVAAPARPQCSRRASSPASSPRSCSAASSCSADLNPLARAGPLHRVDGPGRSTPSCSTTGPASPRDRGGRRRARRPAARPGAAWRSAAIAIVSGTVVTGAGPHAGDERRRLHRAAAVRVHDAARIHGTVARSRSSPSRSCCSSACGETAPTRRVLACRPRRCSSVLVLQAAIGYTQYFTGVPAAARRPPRRSGRRWCGWRPAPAARRCRLRWSRHRRSARIGSCPS